MFFVIGIDVQAWLGRQPAGGPGGRASEKPQTGRCRLPDQTRPRVRPPSAHADATTAPYSGEQVSQVSLPKLFETQRGQPDQAAHYASSQLIYTISVQPWQYPHMPHEGFSICAAPAACSENLQYQLICLGWSICSCFYCAICWIGTRFERGWMRLGKHHRHQPGTLCNGALLPSNRVTWRE